MKGKSGWWRLATLSAAALCAFAALASCAGKDVNVAAQSTSDGEQQAPAVAATITEDEVASLPQWQQDLLNDPGWQQSPIPQVIETPVPAPSHELLLESQRKASQAVYAMPNLRQDSAKHSSWVGGYQPTGSISQGESNMPCSAQPLSGCWDCINNRLFERNILEADSPGAGQMAISFVEKGISSSNHFNKTGGATNNSLCATYQTFSTKRTADPSLPYSAYNPPSTAPGFTEISYRADGGPDANGDPCNGTAYLVKDFVWWKYNQQNFNALPGMNTTALYNILLAPSSELSDLGTSDFPNSTKARIQNFYCGSLSNLYGGGAIVTIESSSSSCAAFTTTSIQNNRLFFTNPIYGVLLKRWQDSVLDSMQAPNNNPWNGDFGWPVQGPTALNNGASTLTGKGAYYAWGMYFERGFIWWVDYINNSNVPDEAQAYQYMGANVFCKGGEWDYYEKLPTIYYGGTGPLGVSVIVEASLNPDRGSGSPPAGTYYEVFNPWPPAEGLLLDMHAHGYGGTPRASDARYKHYTWAFRDGTIGVTNGVAFDDSTKYVQHSYFEPSHYTVRVQVVDVNGAVAYGDSLPIHVNTGSGSGN